MEKSSYWNLSNKNLYCFSCSCYNFLHGGRGHLCWYIYGFTQPKLPIRKKEKKVKNLKLFKDFPK